MKNIIAISATLMTLLVSSCHEEDICPAGSCSNFEDTSDIVENFRLGKQRGTLSGLVVDESNSQMDGATIKLQLAGELVDSATTDTSGNFLFESIGIETDFLVSISKQGYISQHFLFDTQSTSPVYSLGIVTMTPVDLNLSFDANAGSVISGIATQPEASVEIEPNSLVDEQGQIYTGNVNANLSFIDPALAPESMPGDFNGISAGNNEAQPIESFGAIEFSMTDDNGLPLSLAENQSANIQIPAVGPTPYPATIPLFYFDELSGNWVEEGEASLNTNGTPADSSDDFYEGSVTHFTFWNADKFYETMYVEGCLLDSNTGQPISGVRVFSRGIDYTGQSSDFTDANGYYRVAARINSKVNLFTNRSGTTLNDLEINTGNGDIDFGCSSPSFDDNFVKLTWDEHPADLDSWLVGPDGSGSQFKVAFYDQITIVAGSKFELLFDDTDSFGPEYIKFSTLPVDGTYKYSVHHYSGDGTISNSATVELNFNGVTHVFTPGQNVSSQLDNFRVWNVFEIRVESGIANIIEIDQFRPAS